MRPQKSFSEILACTKRLAGEADFSIQALVGGRPGKGLGEGLEVGTAEEEEGEGGSVDTERAYAG